MKKIIVILLSIFIFCACSAQKGSFSMLGADGFITIVAENADTDSSAETTVTADDGEQIRISSKLEKGIVVVSYYKGEANENNLIGRASLERESEQITTLPKGSYTIVATVAEKATGTIIITIEMEDVEDTGNDSQNPIMNFVGVYAKDRCQINVMPLEDDYADFVVTWSNNAASHDEWHMSGKFDPETLSVTYDNCTKKEVVFKTDGSIESEEIKYENGTGTFTFNPDTNANSVIFWMIGSTGTFTFNPDTNVLTWKDDIENAADGIVFEYAN